MLDYEHALGVYTLNGTTLRVCEGEGQNYIDEKYYFIERDLTIPDLASLVRKHGDKIPAHVIGGLTGRARLWLDRPGWALEYMVDEDEEPCFFAL